MHLNTSSIIPTIYINIEDTGEITDLFFFFLCLPILLQYVSLLQLVLVQKI